MVELDPSIISRSVGPDVPLNDLSSVYNNAANFQQRRQEIAAQAEATRQRQVMNDGYAAATRPDGTVDAGVLQAHLAQNNYGSAIPAVQKSNMDMATANATLQGTQATTQAKTQETIYNGLKQVDSSIASLAADPNVNEQKVYGEMGRLVNAGAFDAQAQHVGVTPDIYAKQLLSTMPVGNPPALKSWLVENGMRVADASKRLEMTLPKYDAQNRGGTINEGTINQITGQRTDGTSVPLTASPDSVMTNNRMAANASLELGVKGLTEEQNKALSAAINEGRIDPNRINSRTASLLADLAISNPKTDFNKLGADSALLKNAAFQQKAMVASTLPEIMTNMVTAGKKLDFSDIKAVGHMQAWVKGETNDPQWTDYMTQRNDALMSIAATMRGVGMTDMAHKAETEVASPTMSPTALDAWMAGQMRSLEPRLRNNARIMHTPAPGTALPPGGGVPGSVAAPVAPVAPAGSGARPDINSFFQ